MNKFQDIYDQLTLECGWSDDDATTYISYMKRKSPESLYRAYRKRGGVI